MNQHNSLETQGWEDEISRYNSCGHCRCGKPQLLSDAHEIVTPAQGSAFPQILICYTSLGRLAEYPFAESLFSCETGFRRPLYLKRGNRDRSDEKKFPFRESRENG